MGNICEIFYNKNNEELVSNSIIPIATPIIEITDGVSGEKIPIQYGTHVESPLHTEIYIEHCYEEYKDSI